MREGRNWKMKLIIVQFVKKVSNYNLKLTTIVQFTREVRKIALLPNDI